ncbi:MAG: hypothetical protein WD557_05180 [Dehalococcoidia bacterium]
MEFSEIDVVAQREYRDGAGRTLTLTLGRPVPDSRPGNAWACPYAIQLGQEEPRVREIFGADALQALFLALRIVKVDLEVRDREHGPLTWGGEPGLWLDFP